MRGGRRFLRTGLRLALALVLALVLLEAALRFLLFSDIQAVRDFAAPLRDESLYTATEAGRESWKVRALLDGPDARAHPFFDARVGWSKEELDRETFRHADEALLAGRRPVLLYGDSYAACTVRRDYCWQGLLERSELGKELCLLNYGVGGYGLDQCALLLENSIDLYAHLDPIVVVGILVDDDLDRSYLPLRGYPKPWFELQGSELVLHAPESAGPREYVALHPPGIWSYAARWLFFGRGVFGPERRLAWCGEANHVEVKRALNSRLIGDIQDELESRGLDYFFILFHARGSARSAGPFSWQEPFLYAELEARAIPFVSSKRFLLEHARAKGWPLENYFIAKGAGKNHYTVASYALVFEALRAGLEGRFAPYEYLADL